MKCQFQLQRVCLPNIHLDWQILLGFSSRILNEHRCDCFDTLQVIERIWFEYVSCKFVIKSSATSLSAGSIIIIFENTQRIDTDLYLSNGCTPIC